MVCWEKRAKNSSSQSSARVRKTWLDKPVERGAGSVRAGTRRELRAESQSSRSVTRHRRQRRLPQLSREPERWHGPWHLKVDTEPLTFGNILLRVVLRWGNV